AAARAHRGLVWSRQLPRHWRALVAAHASPAAAADQTFAHHFSPVACSRDACARSSPSCPATHGDHIAAARTSSPAATRSPYRRPPAAEAATSLLTVLLVNPSSSGRSTSAGASVPPAASAKMDAAAAWTSTNPASAAPRSAAPRPKWVVANDTAAVADDRSTANNSACPTLNARPAGR